MAGTLNVCGYAEGAPGAGRLYFPYQVAVGSDGSLYIADYDNGLIRKVPATGSNAGQLTTIAGGGGAHGSTAALLQSLSGPTGVAIDTAHNDDVYIADYGGQKVYHVVQATGAIDLVAGTGSSGFNGDQTDATLAQLSNPYFLHVRGSYLYISDSANGRIRQVTLNYNGNPRPIATVAGTTSTGYNGDGDLAIVSQLSTPIGVWTDPTGNLIIADSNNARIRQVTIADGTIHTIVGSGNAGYSGDNGPGLGVTVTAQVASGGPGYLPAQVGGRVDASNWTFSNVNTTQSGPTFTFQVQQNSPEVSSGRMGTPPPSISFR